MPNLLQRLIASGTISRIRRNHALEHATLHILGSRFPSTTFVGRSDTRGFWLYGEAATEAVEEAVRQAKARLSTGEHRLAVHPHCGTTYLTAGVLATAVSLLSLQAHREEDWRARLSRLPFAVLLTVLALIVAQPLGNTLQQHLTTQPDLASLDLVSVRRHSRGRSTVHRVLTSG
ncbi:MAG: DUF6391 domain-containing protein [Anaerolineales bacterium]|jgi:hypothetical protein